MIICFLTLGDVATVSKATNAQLTHCFVFSSLISRDNLFLKDNNLVQIDVTQLIQTGDHKYQTVHFCVQFAITYRIISQFSKEYGLGTLDKK